MPYIDGFVIAVPTANRQKFIEHARHFDTLFLELGALRVIEAWGDGVGGRGARTSRIADSACSRSSRRSAAPAGGSAATTTATPRT